MKSTISSKLKERCQDLCELCTTDAATVAYTVSPKSNDVIENEVALCDQCMSIIDGKEVPIPYEEALDSSRVSIEVANALRSG